MEFELPGELDPVMGLSQGLGMERSHPVRIRSLGCTCSEKVPGNDGVRRQSKTWRRSLGALKMRVDLTQLELILPTVCEQDRQHPDFSQVCSGPIELGRVHLCVI